LITSASNNFIKMVSSLHHKKGRLEQKLYFAEGIHLVQEALKSGIMLRYFFWSAKLTGSMEGVQLLARLKGKFEGYEVSEALFAKMCETENPQGILVVLQLPDENREMDLSHINLGIVIDSLQDPGNVGTIIRTAWASSLDGVLLTSESADPYQGKVVRSSQGGIFYMGIHSGLEPEQIVQHAQKNHIQIIAGDPKADKVYYEWDLTAPTLILVGNEGSGLQDKWENFSIQKVSIPQPGSAESLNVAVSAGILIYEAIRQRTIKGTCQS
jgi:RNA methyltransferase, TrmH family